MVAMKVIVDVYPRFVTVDIQIRKDRVVSSLKIVS